MTIYVCHTHNVKVESKAGLQMHVVGFVNCDLGVGVDLMKPETARREAREAAHQAVKAFDLSPNIQNTTAAIEALAEYEQHLKEENDGG